MLNFIDTYLKNIGNIMSLKATLNPSSCLALLWLGICLAFVFPATAFSQESVPQQRPAEQEAERARFEPRLDLDRAALQELTADWSEEQKTVMNNLIEEYGPPTEGTESYLIWHDNGPFTRTILSKETNTHNFPFPHEDFLEQTVKMQVPVDRYNALTRLSGSLSADRTRGEVTNRGNSVQMNILALNLANEVANDNRRVEDARQFYAQTAQALQRGETVPYVQELQFSADQANTADPDQALEVQAQEQQQREQ